MRASPRFQPPWILPTSVQAGPAGQGGKGGGRSSAGQRVEERCQHLRLRRPFCSGTDSARTWDNISSTLVRISPTRHSLMVQGLGIRLPEQRTQVQSLFQEDPKSHGETALELQLLKPPGREPRACSEGGHRDRKPERRDEDPSL